MSNRWRITKYNPTYRSECGGYLRPDWTSVSDVGKVISGKLVTPSDYLAVEDAYTKVAMSFVDEMMLKVKAVGVELREGPIGDFRAVSLRLTNFCCPKEGKELRGKELERVIRAILREYFWCKLECSQRLQIHFGTDYYMFVGASRVCKKSIQLAKSKGLFVEPFRSPYLRDYAGRAEEGTASAYQSC